MKRFYAASHVKRFYSRVTREEEEEGEEGEDEEERDESRRDVTLSDLEI